ncbi:MAG: hypothetical protein K6G75_10440 [Lachnospiraceae bacterium]|nr:hypothetical protein [Lachnospiraceae bacterium]
MIREKLTKISIGNGITVLVLDVIWVVLSFLVDPETLSPASLLAVESIVSDFCFFVSFLLGLVGVIYTLIILPFCIKENKLQWIVGFLLNLISLVIPGILVAFIGFLIFCLTNPFA